MDNSKIKLLVPMVMLVCAVAFADVARAADERGRLSGQVGYNRISPPAAGVRLLNLILDRVHSTPAFAMINKDQSLKKYDGQNFAQLGISNYQLAIKPKQSPRGGLCPPPPPPALMSSLPSAGSIRIASANGAVNVMPINEVRGSGVNYFRARSLAIVNDAPAPQMEADAPQNKAERLDVLSKTKRKETLSLLPPNVATGIPLVRLGITQAEAGQSLKTWGSMREEVIGAWTVWSFQKPNSEEPLLQVYMRHGLVEALRIFDPVLVGHGLGVGLNDNVRILKEQFGEPSFILSEPQPGAGQNYVYPLSQVAFLLSRPNPKSEPEVVSLLIFNVK